MNGDCLPAVLASTLAAVIHVYSRDGRATVRTVAAARGRGIQTTHSALLRLRDRGLVAWTEGQTGTCLWPCLWPVDR